MKTVKGLWVCLAVLLVFFEGKSQQLASFSCDQSTITPNVVFYPNTTSSYTVTSVFEDCMYLCGPNTTVYDTSFFTVYRCRVVLINPGSHFIVKTPSCQHYDAVFVKNNGTVTINPGSNTNAFHIFYEPLAVINDQTSNATTWTCTALQFPTVNCNNVGTERFFKTDSSIDIFPTPTAGKFFVQLKSGIINPVIEIYNSQGKMIYREVHSEQTRSIDLSKFSNGIYMVKVLDKTSLLISRKIILAQ